MLVPMQVAVDTNGFTPVPPNLTVAFASFIVLLIFARLARHPRTVVAADGTKKQVNGPSVWTYFALITAATIPIALSQQGLLGSVASSVHDKISSQASIVGVTIVLTLVVVGLGARYIKTRSGIVLLLFVIAVQAAIALSPLIQEFLALWLNYPVRWVWNIVFGIILAILGYEVSF